MPLPGPFARGQKVVRGYEDTTLTSRPKPGLDPVGYLGPRRAAMTM
jgi:hypothetical protein